MYFYQDYPNILCFYTPKTRRTAAAESKNITKSAISAAGIMYRVREIPAAPQ